MTMAALLPCTWRRVKYRPTGLQKAAHYNGIEGVVLGVKPPVDGGCGETRVILRLTNDDANELLLKRSNMELADAAALKTHEPELARALDRLRLCCSTEIPASAEGLGGALRNLVQGILDVTFPLESRLVDDSFEDMALFDEIRGMLTGVESVCGALAAAGVAESAEEAAEAGCATASAAPCPDGIERRGGAEGGGREACHAGGGEGDGTRWMVSYLGEGMAECIHWRRGALVYMLIATLAADKKELDLEMLDDGLRQLDKMVATRSVRMAEGLDEADGEDAVRTMLASGILSDTHLLAVVYSGEMCYWAQEAVLRGAARREPGKAGGGHHTWLGRAEGGGAAGQDTCVAEKSGGAGNEGGPVCGAETGMPSHAGTGHAAAAHYRRRGVGYLQRYLSAVEIMSAQGPGSVGYGWDTVRAQELLKGLQDE